MKNDKKLKEKIMVLQDEKMILEDEIINLDKRNRYEIYLAFHFYIKVYQDLNFQVQRMVHMCKYSFNESLLFRELTDFVDIDNAYERIKEICQIFNSLKTDLTNLEVKIRDYVVVVVLFLST